MVSQEGAADLIGALPLGDSWIHEDERRKMEYLQDVVAEEDEEKVLAELEDKPVLEDWIAEDMNDDAVPDSSAEGEEEKKKQISLDDKLEDAKSRVKK